MHIDPFAPGDSPQHPANFGTMSPAEVDPPAEDPDVVRYREMLEEFGTAEEQAAALSLDSEEATELLPSFEDLEARAEDGAVYTLRLSLFGTEDEQARDDWTFWQLHERFDFGSAPAASAPKAEWLAYAERVAKVRGEEIPRDEAGEPGTIAQLKEYTSHAFDLDDDQAE
jgi:hypothetical protein